MRFSVSKESVMPFEKEKSLKTLGYTVDDKFSPHSSWILKDGKYLNLNGKSHNLIWDDISDAGLNIEKELEGAIKVNDGENPNDPIPHPYVSLMKGITPVQWSVLEEWLNDFGTKDVYFDLPEYGEAYLFGLDEMSPREIIKWLKDFFASDGAFESAFEDLQGIYNQYYKDIPKTIFDMIIEQDPTFKKSQNKLGTYGKWLLKLYKQNQLNNTGHIKDVLTRFEENKNQLKEKDIMRFKTLEDVDSYLEDTNSYKNTTSRQNLRMVQKAVHNADLDKDAKKVFEDSEWVIYVPETYEASCKLGRGTKWCTATTESEYYYNYYSGQGNLYIIINKKNPEEKYQCHLESGQFMNKEDKQIKTAKFLRENPSLRGFFFEKVKKELGIESLTEDYQIILNLDDIESLSSFYGFKSVFSGEEIVEALTSPYELIMNWGIQDQVYEEGAEPLFQGSLLEILKEKEIDETSDSEILRAVVAAAASATSSGTEEELYDLISTKLEDSVPNVFSASYNRNSEKLYVTATGEDWCNLHLFAPVDDEEREEFSEKFEPMKLDILAYIAHDFSLSTQELDNCIFLDEEAFKEYLDDELAAVSE